MPEHLLIPEGIVGGGIPRPPGSFLTLGCPTKLNPSPLGDPSSNHWHQSTRVGVARTSRVAYIPRESTDFSLTVSKNLKHKMHRMRGYFRGAVKLNLRLRVLRTGSGQE